MEAGVGFGVGISTLFTTGGGGAGFLVVGLKFNKCSFFVPNFEDFEETYFGVSTLGGR